MKKILMYCVGVLAVVSVTSCSKERECRCAVMGETYERVIKIDKGTCEQLRYVLYDLHSVTSHDVTDSVLCTDYFGPAENGAAGTGPGHGAAENE